MFNITIPLGDTVTIQQALFVSVFSMIVVFLVLLIISYMIDAVSLIINRKSKHENK